MKGGCRSSLPLRVSSGTMRPLVTTICRSVASTQMRPSQIALLLFDDFGADVEDVAVHLVHLLPSHVFHVVLADLLGGEHEGISVLDVLEVGGRHHAPAARCSPARRPPSRCACRWSRRSRRPPGSTRRPPCCRRRWSARGRRGDRCSDSAPAGTRSPWRQTRG